MERAFVGFLAGSYIAAPFYVLNSEKFNKQEKFALYICCLFPIVPWIGILILMIYKNTLNEDLELNKKINLDNKIHSLNELKRMGILTEDEYQNKVKKIDVQKIENSLFASQVYLELKSLYDSGILDLNEFEKKVEIARNKIITSSRSNFKKINEGFSYKLGNYIEYIFIDENGIEYKNIYKTQTNNLYFIFRNDNIKYFSDEPTLIQYLKRSL